MTRARALLLGCLLGAGLVCAYACGAGLVCAYAWATRKPRTKGQLGQPAPLMTLPRYVLEGRLSPVDTAVADLFARSWGKPRIALWCDLCGCELLPDGRCPDRDKVHPT